ncbi:MAG TPA: YerC/YecD family TrpR-related protein [Candidatus Dojkabacteria bacterium]|nr:YerC/YecD family TrpR-related protein [Candidatus Dojkabacteria bacterium]
MKTKYEVKQDNTRLNQLIDAFLSIDNEKLMFAFLRDLLTQPEIKEFSNRLEVARLLDSGMSQREVSALTGVSIATVTRVNQWLKRGNNGYNEVLILLKNPLSKNLSHSHT